MTTTIKTIKLGIDMSAPMAQEILRLLADQDHEILNRIQHDFLPGQDRIIYATLDDWQGIMDCLIADGQQDFANALLVVIA